MPSASRVSAAWRRVAQSDWLPMTIATGFAAIRAFQVGDFIQIEGADYKNRVPQGKAKHPPPAVNLASLLGKRAPSRRSRDDVGGELVLDEGDAVAQEQLALFEPLHLKRVGADGVLQRANGGIEVPVLLLQAHERRAELAFFLFGHRRGAARVGAVSTKNRPRLGRKTVCRRKSDQIRNFRRPGRRLGRKSCRIRPFQYPGLAVPLQAEWRFGYDLARIAALHNRCDVTAGPIRGTL